MAPEQATAGARITPATDLFALGLIAYRLLAGETTSRATRSTSWHSFSTNRCNRRPNATRAGDGVRRLVRARLSPQPRGALRLGGGAGRVAVGGARHAHAGGHPGRDAPAFFAGRRRDGSREDPAFAVTDWPWRSSRGSRVSPLRSSSWRSGRIRRLRLHRPPWRRPRRPHRRWRRSRHPHSRRRPRPPPSRVFRLDATQRRAAVR